RALRTRLAYTLPGVPPLEKLADHVPQGPARAEIDRPDDIRVLQLGRGLELLHEPVEQFRVCGEVHVEDLHRDDVSRVLVCGLVNRAHPALADELEEVVTADRGQITFERAARHGRISLRVPGQFGPGDRAARR